MSIAYLIMPAVLTLLGAALFFSRRPLFEEFIAGAREGLECAVRLLPTLVLLMSATSFFSASGTADFLAGLLAPLFDRIGVPPELAPLLIVRPVSGSASTALTDELFRAVGPDSFAGLAGSVIIGSSDTILYISAVYFSSVGVKHTRHTIPIALAVSVFCVFFACALCRVFYI